MYDHTKQYRCTIIRGKSKEEMDDLLPAYALVIDKICPCLVSDFDSLFNNEFKSYLSESNRVKKTLDNHRTEIAGKLFGMYYRSDDGMVYESQRTAKYLEDSDQPAFFKDICYKMQFPNGMDSSQTLKDKINNKIKIRPNAYVLKMLRLAKDANVDITVKEIGYYVLNSLDVLQGRASPYEVLEAIVHDHETGTKREIKAFDKNGKSKASSYTMQHIREQLNYLELANLIRITDNNRLVLNTNESDTINIFLNDYNAAPEFDVYSYSLETVEERKQFQASWDKYYATLSSHSASFATNLEALMFKEDSTATATQAKTSTGTDLTQFGDEGEALVYEYEKMRVSAFNARLANKVLSLGKVKGLGYDIQSVIAEPGDTAEYVKYIEVKSTRRFTCPDPTDLLWMDTLNITRNEWVAANQHGKYYYIARVYFTSKGVTMFMLANVAEKLSDGRMKATPTTYRLDFSQSSVDKVISLGQTTV